MNENDTLRPDGSVRTTIDDVSLRDYFAAMALTGFCAVRVTQEDRDRANVHTEAEVLTRLVENAYHVADAMLKARAK